MAKYCKCGDTIHPIRVKYGYNNCVSCSTTQRVACAPITNHKTGNTIQIDTATTKLIKSGNNFTVTTNQVASDDKSLCCPPKDTSPPFAANDDGMETVSDYKILEFSQGNVVFDTFRATVDSSNTYTAATTSDYTSLLGTSTTKRIRLQTASGEFKLLTS